MDVHIPTSIDMYWSEITLSIIMILVLLLVMALFSTYRIHREIKAKMQIIPREADDMIGKMGVISGIVSKEKLDVSGKEKDVVVEEISKISQLWKSRREQLKMGYWEKMEAKADELDKLHEEKKQIEELIKRTKVKYHKRELDEESFREIVKEYQKKLMEANVKIWELERRLG